MSDVIKDGEHWWCSLFEKPAEAALWAAGSTINPYSVGISPPGSVVETSDKPFSLEERLKLVEGQAAEDVRFALAALSEPDDLPDVPLSERGFGV